MRLIERQTLAGIANLRCGPLELQYFQATPRLWVACAWGIAREASPINPDCTRVSGGAGGVQQVCWEPRTPLLPVRAALKNRIQLTLFVPHPEAGTMEQVRLALDPIQSHLIAAHVTLCREDELLEGSAEALGARLDEARPGPLTLSFGAPEVFQGHGVMLPCVAGQGQFQALRRIALGTEAARPHAPHMTLAHPRNPKAPSNHPGALLTVPTLIDVTFVAVSLIYQESGQPWRVLREFALAKPR